MINNNHETPKVPKGYKQTEVGIIPNDWGLDFLENLSDVIDPHPSHRAPPEENNGIPFLGIGDFDENGCIIKSSYRVVAPAIYNEHLLRYQLEFGLLGLGRVASIGKVIKLRTDLGKYTISPTLGVIKPKFIDKDYLFNYLKSIFVVDQFTKIMSGSTRSSVGMIVLRKLLIVIPHPKEQTAIAKALSDVDALIAELEKLIAKKEAIKTGAMQQLLTGKTRLPQFAKREDGTPKGYKDSEFGKIPEDWEVISLFDLADNRKELFDDGDWIEAQYITDKGVRLIQTGNIGIGYFVEKNDKKYISEDSFSLLKCKKLKVRDILICRLAEPAGRACLFLGLSDENVITSVDVTIFRPLKNISREFYVQYFSTSEWFKSISEHVGGTTHKRISRGSLAKILVPLPKEEEQVAIAEILSDMDSEIEALEKRLEKTKSLKQGMMQELLTGRTRLV